jgi:hypothetical protein
MWPHSSQRVRPVIMRGVGAGLIAGIPQVIVLQAEAFLLSVPRGRADIGPRFVYRLSEYVDAEVPTAAHWLVAGALPFRLCGVLGIDLRAASALATRATTCWWSTARGADLCGRIFTMGGGDDHWHRAALSFSLSLAYLFARLERWPKA